jgi:predicted type IV restriction endonuclease
MSAPKEIIELVDRFNRNIESYKSGHYNETQLRREFIDPLFEALGWDVNNKSGYAEAYKEVIHEDSIKVGAGTKAPDYCFRIGGTRKFFLEAKKPSVDIKIEVSPAYQIRRYAWSAKLPLSILSDFEELAVYDCRIKPSKNDKSSVARILLINFREYIDRWAEIAAIFSKEAIQKGSFDKFIESGKKKRGTTEVDNVFLEEIESWREMLAKDIAKHNPRLSQRELNFAVQRTIDRIIFLRICEDRGIEEYGRLMALQNGGQAYLRLCELYRHADDKYNSGLFHFREEKNIAELPDELTLRIKISDDPLKDIIKRLYYPESPYEFSIISADILGQVYEQFLGKVIRLTAGHRAIVEEKPEVRKAGGIYYTPSYIVDYIVKNTVGKLLEGKNPKTASKLRILDPACGSGHFLIGAYQYLLDWHLNWYVKDGSKKWAIKKPPVLYQDTHGDWRLTTSERKRILLNNIYGVDIDPQAVEVTKLSLLLKVLEGETEQTLNTTLRLFRERALPDLGNNIKCGNSLIGPEFYQNQQVSMFNDEERYRINAFDWNKEFKEIMCSGGFDVVIGNPPWGSLLSTSEKIYLQNNYVNKQGEAESHLFFLEKGFKLLSKSGMLGYITPNTWLTVIRSEQTRDYFLKYAHLYETIELSKYIFRDAPDIVPILVFLKRYSTNKAKCIVKRANVNKVNEDNFDSVFSVNEVQQSIWSDSPGHVINIRIRPDTIRINDKCKSESIPLCEICDVQYGIKTGNNSKYLSKSQTRKHRVKALKTGELSRYHIEWKQLFLFWCQELAGYRTSSVEVPKIIVQYIRKISLPRRIIAALDYDGEYYPLNNYSYIILKNNKYSIKYILGVINSSLINFYFANNYIDYNIKPTYLQQLPIHIIDFNNKDESSLHKDIAGNVDNIAELVNKLASARTDQDKTSIQRQIDATDKQIDQLVYKLYGLTEEEIRVVEGKQ